MELAIIISTGLVIILLIWLIASNVIASGKIDDLQKKLEYEKQWRKSDNSFNKDNNKRLIARIEEQDAAFRALSKLLPGPFDLLFVRRSDGYGNDVKQWDKDKIIRLAKRVKSESSNETDDKVIKKLGAFNK